MLNADHAIKKYGDLFPAFADSRESKFVKVSLTLALLRLSAFGIRRILSKYNSYRVGGIILRLSLRSGLGEVLEVVCIDFSRLGIIDSLYSNPILLNQFVCSSIAIIES